jgi:ribokinase
MIVKGGEIPRPGQTVIGGRFSTAAGGKGANQAVAAARAGGQVAFVGRVGDDDMGRRARDGLAKEGIDVTHLITDDCAASGVALIMVDSRGQNSIAVAGGANDRVTAGDVEAARGVIAGADILLVQLEIPLEAVKKAVFEAKGAGVKVILNPAPACGLNEDILSCVSILTPNESEAGELAGMRVETVEEAEKAGLALVKRGVETVIVTMGEKGVVVVSAYRINRYDAFEVKAVDTTAAGDVFNGVLAIGLGEGMEMEEAVRFGAAGAAISVTKIGAQPSIPGRREIVGLLEKGK